MVQDCQALTASQGAPLAPPASNWAEVLWNRGSTAKAASSFFTFRASKLASKVALGLHSRA